MNRKLGALSWVVLVVASVVVRTVVGESFYALYVSKDQGRSWAPSTNGVRSDKRINALASTKATIVAGTDVGILISTNNAQSWTVVSIPGQEQVRVQALATIGEGLFAGTSEGLLGSADGGAHWEVKKGFPRRSVRSLQVMGETLYVGTDADHVYRSTDKGETWEHLSAGLPPNAQVFSLTSIGRNLFAGLYAQGLYTWTEAYQNWQQVGASDGIRPLALAANGRTLIAGHNPGGLYWSDDLGQTWTHWAHSDITRANVSNAPNVPETVDPLGSLDSILAKRASSLLQAPIWELAANSELAIAGAGSGIYYSTDHARSWSRATVGLPAASSGIGFLVRNDLIVAAIHHKSPSCAGATEK